MSNRLGLNGTEENRRLIETPPPKLPFEYQEDELFRIFRTRSLERRQAQSIREVLEPQSVRRGESLPRGRITGPVKFLAKLQEAWELEDRHLSVLLGLDESEKETVSKLLNGTITLKGRDAKDRVGYLLEIRQKLSSLFRDMDNERRWLREPQSILEGKSPLDLLLEGSMQNLIRLHALVSYVAGV